MKTEALYIHIPFCTTICTYCDFPKVFYHKQQVSQYLDRLAQELDEIPSPMKTIYIGGGTPGALSMDELTRLMAMIQRFIDDHTIEVTIEVNPETMTQEKLELLIESGVNRLSVGVQSFNDELVRSLNRQHHREQSIDMINLAHQLGFDNISIDLMYGLPHQHINNIEDDLAVVSQLPVTHVSYYDLIIEPHTVLGASDYEGIDEDEDYQSTMLINKTLSSLGFHHYEISNYAKEGYESEHNKAYWHYDNYYGVGVGAAAKIDDCFYTHTRALNRYLRGESIIRQEKLTFDETMFNQVMMSLRLVEGLDLQLFMQRYHCRIEDVYPEALKKHLDNGNLVIEDHHLKATSTSINYLNDILCDFLD